MTSSALHPSALHQPDLYPGTQLPRLALTSVEASDIDMIHTWLADEKASAWLDMGSGRQSLTKLQLYALLTGKKTCARLIGFPGQAPVGLVCLNDADNLMGTAEIWGVRGVYAGGGANFSVSAFLAMLATGFLDLEREVIASWVVAGNELSLAMHRHLGLTQVGCARGRHVMKGKRYDRVLFDMTREEFGAKYPDVPAESGSTFRSRFLNAPERLSA